jgi:predicted acetyltransferase
LVDDNDEIVAVSNLRHRLNEHLLLEGGHIGYGVRPSARLRGHAKAVLAATLKEAKGLGITRCLVTCDRDNLGSAQTIKRNGGSLESEIFSETRGAFIQRYWIDIVEDG